MEIDGNKINKMRNFPIALVIKAWKSFSLEYTELELKGNQAIYISAG